MFKLLAVVISLLTNAPITHYHGAKTYDTLEACEAVIEEIGRDGLTQMVLVLLEEENVEVDGPVQIVISCNDGSEP